MRVAKPTSMGLDMEYYSLELPQNVSRPDPYDGRWQLTGRYVKTGQIPETGHFSLVKQYDAAGNLLSEETRSFY